MNEILEELQQITNAISALNDSRLESFINVVAIILLPLTTIIFSVYSAWKQNEVSLFAQRYETYLELCRLLRLRNRLDLVLTVDPESKVPRAVPTDKVCAYIARTMGYAGEDFPAEYLAKSDASMRQVRFLFSKLSAQELEGITDLRHAAYNFIDKTSRQDTISRDDESVRNFFNMSDAVGTITDEVYADQVFPRKATPAEAAGDSVVKKMEAALQLSRKWSLVDFFRHFVENHLA